MAALLADPAYALSREQARAFESDPLTYLINVSRRVGVGMIVSGCVLGATGWFLKASATTSGNNITNTLGSMSSVFSNIKQPSFQPAPMGSAPVLGPNPIQDIQNFGLDVASDLQGVLGDVAQAGGVLGTLGEDVAVGLIDIGKAILSFVMNFPQLLWNGLVWSVGGGIADVFNWLFSYLIVFGLILVAVSVAASVLRWLWAVSVSQGLRASVQKWSLRQEARVEAFWDKLLRNYRSVETVAVAPVPQETVSTQPPAASEVAGIKAPAEEEVENPPLNVETSPVIEAAPAAEAERTQPDEGGEGGPPTALAPDPNREEGTAEADVNPSAAAEVPPPPIRETNGTTEQTQDLLGGVPPPGWSEEDVERYLRAAPPPVEKKWSGAEIAARADELLA